MSLPTSRELISEVVRDWTSQELLFTAYDVSKAVQRLQKDRSLPFERHIHMKQDVHNEVTHYLASNYRSRIQSIGTPVPPWIYYPEGSDSNVYVLHITAKNGGGPCNASGDAVDTITTPQPVANPANSAAVTAATNSITSINIVPTLPEGARRGDARGSLVVASSLLRDAGFAPKDQAWIFSIVHDNKPALRISKFQNPNDPDPLTNYTVDYHNNVRITETILETAGLTVGQNAIFKFDRDGNSVVVSNHD